MFLPSLPKVVSLRSAVSLTCSICWRRFLINSTLALSLISRVLAKASISASASVMVSRISLTVFLRRLSNNFAMAVPSFLCSMSSFLSSRAFSSCAFFTCGASAPNFACKAAISALYFSSMALRWSV